MHDYECEFFYKNCYLAVSNLGRSTVPSGGGRRSHGRATCIYIVGKYTLHAEVVAVLREVDTAASLWEQHNGYGGLPIMEFFIKTLDQKGLEIPQGKVEVSLK
jgi:hypothetical protein